MGVRVDWHSVRLAIRADRSRFGNVSQGSLCVRSPSASIVCDRAWCLPPVCTTPYLLARSVLACSVLPGEYLPGEPSERRLQQRRNGAAPLVKDEIFSRAPGGSRLVARHRWLA